MDGSLAPYAIPVGAWGPVRMLSLVIFLQEMEEVEEEREKNRDGLRGRNAYCRVLWMQSAPLTN